MKQKPKSSEPAKRTAPNAKGYLGILLQRLREARREFSTPHDHKKTRDGTISALTAVIDYMATDKAFAQFRKENLSIPLTVLLAALHDLDSGVTHPILKARKKPGRRASSTIRQEVMGAASAALKMLIDLGVPERQAAKIVAATLSKTGLKKHGGGNNKITGVTIIEWKCKISEGPKDSAAVMMEEWALKECRPVKTLPIDTAKQHILKGIQAIAVGFKAPGA